MVNKIIILRHRLKMLWLTINGDSEDLEAHGENPEFYT